MACATCHVQSLAFTDGKAVATGITGQTGARSAMALANVAYLPTLTWANPQLKALEMQQKCRNFLMLLRELLYENFYPFINLNIFGMHEKF
jgi:hypothetical protein